MLSVVGRHALRGNKVVWSDVSQRLPPKADNTFDGHCPQKAPFCGRGFCSWPPASLFVRFREPSPHSFVPNTKYGKTLRAVWECGSGTLMLVPRAYKAWVGRISCRCGSVVVVHSCFYQAFIKHEWGASLADVGLHSKSSYTWYWEQNRMGLTFQIGQTSLRMVKKKILPNNFLKNNELFLSKTTSKNPWDFYLSFYS